LKLPKWKYVFGKLGEQDAVLVFEELHLDNIRQLELELLIRARAREEPTEEPTEDQAANDPRRATRQLAQKEDHELLHAYRQCS
jgi:hypothetical protein